MRSVPGTGRLVRHQRAENRFRDRLPDLHPFVIIDLVVASVLMSMGMMMLSPMLVSAPFKFCCSCWSMAGC